MVQVGARQVTVLDPTGEVLVRPLRLAPRLEGLRGKVAALLDNSMPMTGLLMDTLGEVLMREHGVARVVRRSKPNMSVPCPPDTLEELLQEADFLVAGVGV